MTVAVSGSGSMIGKRLVRRLEPTCTILSVGRGAGSNITMDLESCVSALPAARTTDVVVHCAASFGGKGIEELIANEMVNAVGCLRIAQLAAAMRCRHLVNVSSVFELPENAHKNSYGLSKRHGQENLELACGELGIDLTTLLVTHVYDDLGEARKHQPMFYRIIDCARDGRVFSFFGENDPLRNFLFVEDLVSVIERVIRDRITGGYAVVHPVSYRISQIVDMAFEAFGSNPSVVRCPDKPNIPTVWYPADTTLYGLINYCPETDLRTGIELVRDRMPRSSSGPTVQ